MSAGTARIAGGGAPALPIRVLRLGPWSVRIRVRPLIATAVLIAALLVVGVLMLGAGTMRLAPDEIWRALLGDGEASAVRSVQGRRLPRLLTAVGVGGSLGVAGAVFQSISRNVLGSPDVIGFTTGAATGAVVQITIFGGGMLAIALSAIGGGLATALVVYLLARKDGVTGGLRLVLVGIGTGAVLGAITDFLIVRADITDAGLVQQWTAGSLTGRGWTHALAALGVAVVVGPVLAAVARRVTLMEMGDDLAAGLGVRVERVRFTAMLLAVLLVGVATAVAGPIAFIALAAPQIARRLTRSGGVQTVASFATGAMLLVAADFLAQTVEVGLRTPVGLVTSLLGGAYLVWLLARRA